jgi:hypothetical protein
MLGGFARYQSHLSIFRLIAAQSEAERQAEKAVFDWWFNLESHLIRRQFEIEDISFVREIMPRAWLSPHINDVLRDIEAGS